jgi:outer membrane protein OmpA-like peptidoglycan-associated protein
MTGIDKDIEARSSAESPAGKTGAAAHDQQVASSSAALPRTDSSLSDASSSTAGSASSAGASPAAMDEASAAAAMDAASATAAADDKPGSHGTKRESEMAAGGAAAGVGAPATGTGGASAAGADTQAAASGGAGAGVTKDVGQHGAGSEAASADRAQGSSAGADASAAQSAPPAATGNDASMANAAAPAGAGSTAGQVGSQQSSDKLADSATSTGAGAGQTRAAETVADSASSHPLGTGSSDGSSLQPLAPAEGGPRSPTTGEAAAPQQLAGVVEAPGKKVTSVEEVIPQRLGGLLPMTLGVEGEGEFDFDRAVLRQEVKSRLDTLADKLKGAEYDRLEIVGHTDRIGTVDYNQYLSERRAWAVARYLVAQGVPLTKMRVEGHGMKEPLTRPDECPFDSREQLIPCMQKDRRVEISASIRRTDVEIH